MLENEFKIIFETVYKHYKIGENVEITLEANPEDVTLENIKLWLSLGINRLSIGCQSFDDEILKKLNRRHKAEDSIKALYLAKENGIENISADLIYGIPGLSDNDWKENISRLLNIDVPHISAYNLTVEPKTALEILINKGKYPSLDEEQGRAQFEILMQMLAENSYEHYEISNFAKDKKYSRHNTNYWLNKKYLGFGPSAHSYDLEKDIGILAILKNILKVLILKVHIMIMKN